ncbi:MAG: hypothetical protein ACFB50_00515 [Rubrobacteraceae bacterium]
MHTLNELDLARQRLRERLQEAENERLASRLRSAAARKVPGRSLFGRFWIPVRPAAKETGLRNRV